ncbi:transposase [Okeania sp. KiyG1]|uniref:transposase n=1 Tax=Okeania sp. KiyG1 TaxID=2720165 RepID=UPI001922D691|nr:transposase [Okeania sp. KiyG1]
MRITYCSIISNSNQRRRANGRSPLHRYFLSFVVEIQPEVLPKTDNSVGIDLGIKTFATFSDGTQVDAPKPLKKRIKKLRKVKFVIIS